MAVDGRTDEPCGCGNEHADTSGTRSMRHEPRTESNRAHRQRSTRQSANQTPDEIMPLISQIQRVIVRLLILEPQVPFHLFPLKARQDRLLRLWRIRAETVSRREINFGRRKEDVDLGVAAPLESLRARKSAFPFRHAILGHTFNSSCSDCSARSSTRRKSPETRAKSCPTDSAAVRGGSVIRRPGFGRAPAGAKKIELRPSTKWRVVSFI